MKVLLINPYDITDKEFGPPRMGLGLAYLASAIRKENAADVKILDKFAEYRLSGFNARKTEALLDNILSYYRPDIIGFSTYTETIADVIKDTIRIKEKLPSALTVIGGAHATAIPEETLRHYSSIDIAVIGEGEYALLDIIKGISPEQIKGIVFKKNGEIKKTEQRTPIFEIDRIPYPARDMFNMKYYNLPAKEVHSRGNYRYASILSSRGCRAACSFCLQVKVHRRFSAHSVGYVISEIEYLLSNYSQINALEFIDNLFLCDTEHTEDLCRAMIKAGINKRLKWKAQTRPGRLKPENLALMKEAGCFMLGFGFESGSQRILDRMNKRTSVAECLESARLTKEAGIQLEAYFIYGYPDETKEDLSMTFDVVKKMNPTFVGYGRFSPVPGSLDYDRLIRQNRIRYRYDDLSLDWQKINLYRENVAQSYSAVTDREFEELEQYAIYHVVKPINIRYHMANINRIDILRLSYLWKLFKKSFILFKDPEYFLGRVKDFFKIALRKRS